MIAGRSFFEDFHSQLYTDNEILELLSAPPEYGIRRWSRLLYPHRYVLHAPLLHTLLQRTLSGGPSSLTTSSILTASPRASLTIILAFLTPDASLSLVVTGLSRQSC